MEGLAKVPNYVYQDRRRVVIALFLTVFATVSDSLSKHGTGWPILVSFGFFSVLTTAPLTLEKLLDRLSKNGHN